MRNLKDILEIANEAFEKGKNERQRTELFAEGLLHELKRVKGTDISPYLSCEFDTIRRQYVITLRFPTTANIFNAGSCNGKCHMF